MAGTGSHRYFAAFSGALENRKSRSRSSNITILLEDASESTPSFLGTRRRDPVGGARAQDGSRHGRT